MPTFRGVRLVSNQDAVLRNGLAAEWLMNESGSTLTDTSGNGNDGTIYGATWYTLPSGYKVLRFDGVDDYVESPSSTSLDMTSEFTVLSWVMLLGSSLDPVHRILRYGSQYTIGIDSDTNKIGGFVWVGTWKGSWGLSSGTVTVGVWSHVGMRFKDGKISMYLNGVEDGGESTGSPIDGASGVLQLGQWTASMPHRLYGLLGPTRIYRRGLQVWEIQAIMNYDKALMGV